MQRFSRNTAAMRQGAAWSMTRSAVNQSTMSPSSAATSATVSPDVTSTMKDTRRSFSHRPPHYQMQAATSGTVDIDLLDSFQDIVSQDGYYDDFETDSTSQYALPPTVEDSTGWYLPPDFDADDEAPSASSSSTGFPPSPAGNSSESNEGVLNAMAQFQQATQAKQGKRSNSKKLIKEQLEAATRLEEANRQKDILEAVKRETALSFGNWTSRRLSEKEDALDLLEEEAVVDARPSLSIPKHLQQKKGRRSNQEKAELAAATGTNALTPEELDAQEEAVAAAVYANSKRREVQSRRMHGIRTEDDDEEEGTLWSINQGGNGEDHHEGSFPGGSADDDEEAFFAKEKADEVERKAFSAANFFGVAKRLSINRVADRVPFRTPAQILTEGQKPLEVRLAEAYHVAIQSDVFAKRQLMRLGFKENRESITVTSSAPPAGSRRGAPYSLPQANQVSGVFTLPPGTSCPNQILYLCRFFASVHMTGARQVPLRFGQHYTSSMPQLKKLSFPLGGKVVITTSNTTVKGLYAVTSYQAKAYPPSEDQQSQQGELEDGVTLLVGATMSQISQSHDVLASVDRHNQKVARPGPVIEEEDDDEDDAELV